MTQEIHYDKQLPVGGQVANFVSEVMGVLATGRRLKARLDAISYGSDFVSLASKTGLPNPGLVSDTQAQDLWTIISIAVTQLDSPQVASLSRLDQG